MPPKPDREQRAVWSMNADGSEVQKLIEPVVGFTHLGSVEFSADGSKLALDMSTGSTTSSHIFVAAADGSGLKDVGSGCMPSFSADGKRMVMSEPGRGVVMMRSDGTERRIVDRAGWGTQWSPDGKHIVYGRQGNLVLMNVASGQKRTLLSGNDANRFLQIYWNMGWSRDGQSVAFKGRNRQTGQYELAVVNLGPPVTCRVLHATSNNFNAECTWSPDDESVVVAMNQQGHEGPRLYAFARDGSAGPVKLAGQPDDKKILDAVWSPDGKTIVFSGIQIPRPVDWPPASSDRP